MFSKQFDRRVYIFIAFFFTSMFVGLSFGLYALWPANVERGYQPVQPIDYSHELHAGTLQIDCYYCHVNAERQAQATVPPVSVCMNCHEEVQTRDENDRLEAETAKLLTYWQENVPSNG